MEAALAESRKKAGLSSHRTTHVAENDPKISEAYNKAHGTDFKPQDVHDVHPDQIRDADLYHASPVCKSLSAANVRGKVSQIDVDSAKRSHRISLRRVPKQYLSRMSPSLQKHQN